MKKFKNLLIYTAMFTGVVLYSCEGPMGPAGQNGEDGTDANESCKLCHNSSVVDSVAGLYAFSKHSFGETAEEETGSTGCAPCHESEGFKYVCKNNTSVAFIPDPANAGKYLNPYASSTSTAYGEFNCFMCHSSLHTDYVYDDFKTLTTNAAVPMSMWGGSQTINLTQDNGSSNLCVKCHQPRPFTNSATDKNVLNYALLASNPADTFYKATRLTGTNVLKPGYRTHTHYGTVGAIFAGKGGVQFSGTLAYTNSSHTTAASCSDCHMATPVTSTSIAVAGGHTFKAKGNFNGCSSCHPSVTNASQAAAFWATPRTEIKGLLDNLAGLLKESGIDILNRNGDSESNLWYGLTANNYDGYLNIYDPVNNPAGGTYNTTMFKNPSTTGFSSGQITTNNGLTALTLTNAQMGAIINFQLCLREYSLGIHNYSYTKALLTNSIALLTPKK